MSKISKTLWKQVLQIAITVLTAIASTLGIQSCMGI